MNIAEVRREGLLDNEDERDRVANYLAAGTAILFTTATTPDMFDPARSAGLTVRSDGVWAWSDVITYYCARYGIAPEPALLQHIRAQGYLCRPLDDEQTDAAVTDFFASRV